MPRPYALVVSEKHVIVPKSSEMTVHVHVYVLHVLVVVHVHILVLVVVHVQLYCAVPRDAEAAHPLRFSKGRESASG